MSAQKIKIMIHKRYTKERLSAADAQRAAHEIVFGPIVFQVSRLMVKFGIFQLLSDHRDGCTAEEIAAHTNLSPYAVKVLMESSLTAGTVLWNDDRNDGRYTLSKVGWFLLNDPMARVNMDFNHDVNYKGMFHLEEALQNGKPEGLKELGDWQTIYEGLSTLPAEAQRSWFAFDHFYSDHSFQQALDIVFARRPKTLLDIGGNTGRWATCCVKHDAEMEVTIMDLPQQLEMMRKQTSSLPEANRIHGYAADLLDKQTVFPTGFDAVWMSQFLDCFSEEQVVDILTRAQASLNPEGRIFVMETLWDRQRYETASYCLAQISLYFTAMANGNSKMFYSGDLEEYVNRAGLTVETIYDNLGYGHSILQLKPKG